ncbi:MAG TPA: hypothetical protein PK156_41355, partial [Polyangium sp.]|nr:hypothetical protein [Polyangium sp.]
ATSPNPATESLSTAQPTLLWPPVHNAARLLEHATSPNPATESLSTAQPTLSWPPGHNAARLLVIVT